MSDELVLLRRLTRLCEYWIERSRPPGDASKEDYNIWRGLGYESKSYKEAKARVIEWEAESGY